MSRIPKKNLQRGVPFFCVAAFLVLMLCVPATRAFFVGVFGWAIVLYLVLCAVAGALLLAGVRAPRLSLKRLALYMAIAVLFLCTMHVLFARALFGSDANYLLDPYRGVDTVGGVLIAAFTAPLKLITHNSYLATVLIYFWVTALLALLALYPFILMLDGREGERKSRKGEGRPKSGKPALHVERLRGKRGVPAESAAEEPSPRPRMDDPFHAPTTLYRDPIPPKSAPTPQTEADRARSRSAAILFDNCPPEQTPGEWYDATKVPTRSAADEEPGGILSQYEPDDPLKFYSNQAREQKLRDNLLRYAQEEYEARYANMPEYRRPETPPKEPVEGTFLPTEPEPVPQPYPEEPVARPAEPARAPEPEPVRPVEPVQPAQPVRATEPEPVRPPAQPTGEPAEGDRPPKEPPYRPSFYTGPFSDFTSPAYPYPAQPYPVYYPPLTYPMPVYPAGYPQPGGAPGQTVSPQPAAPAEPVSAPQGVRPVQTPPEEVPAQPAAPVAKPMTREEKLAYLRQPVSPDATTQLLGSILERVGDDEAMRARYKAQQAALHAGEEQEGAEEAPSEPPKAPVPEPEPEDFADESAAAAATAAAEQSEPAEGGAPEQPPRFRAEKTAEKSAEKKKKAPPPEPEPAPEPPPYHPQPYVAPPLDLLKAYPAAGGDFPEDYARKKEEIDRVLQNEFHVPATVIGAKRGPSFTRYELEMGEGYKVTALSSLAENLKMRLRVRTVRILSPIVGENKAGIEIPNEKTDTVGIRSVLASQEFNRTNKGIQIAFGKMLDGTNYVCDLASLPHLLVAGASGTGKSVFLNALIVSILYKYGPEDVRFMMIDPKRVELTRYNVLPHMLCDAAKESPHAINLLRWLCKEMDRRYQFLEEVGCSSIDQYNDEIRDKEHEPKLYRIVLIVDEMADLMMKSRGDVEDCIVRLAQLARAAGIHMVIATQRPVKAVITGLIKSNILARVGFQVQSQMDSRIIFDAGGAEELLGAGDMLFSYKADLTRMQGAFVSNSEVRAVCDFIKNNNPANIDPEIAREIFRKEEEKTELSAEEKREMRQEAESQETEKLLRKVLKYFILKDTASTSSAQAAFNIGYMRAKRLVETMTERGFISSGEGQKPREVLITMEEYEQLFGNDDADEGEEDEA